MKALGEARSIRLRIPCEILARVETILPGFRERNQGVALSRADLIRHLMVIGLAAQEEESESPDSETPPPTQVEKPAS